MQHVQNIFKVVKGDFQHLPRIVVLTILSISIYYFSWGFAEPFFSVYLGGFSDQYTTIGFFKSMATFTGLLILIPLGDLLDRVDHSKLINKAKLGYAFVGLAYFLAGEFGSIPFLVVGLLANGALSSVIWGATAATIRRESPKRDAGLAFGLYITARQLAFAAGLVLALLLVLELPIHYIFIPLMIFPLLSIIPTRNLPARKAQPMKTAIRDIFVKDKLIGRFIREMKGFNMEMWFMYLLYFLVYIVPVIAMAFLPLYAYDKGYSLVSVGLLVLVMNIPFVFSFISAEIADHSERLRNIIFGAALSAVALGLLSVFHSTSTWLFVLAFFLMAGYSIILPSLSSVITVLTPKKYTGTGSAMIDIALFSAAVVQAPLVGFIIDKLGWDNMFLIAGLFLGAIAIFTVCLQLFFKRRNMLYHINHPKSKHDPYII